MHIKQPPALGTILGAEVELATARGGCRSLGSGRDQVGLRVSPHPLHRPRPQQSSHPRQAMQL